MKCCEKHVARLIIEEESREIKVFARDKKAKGRTVLCDSRWIVEDGSRYEVEPTKDSKAVFIIRTQDNKPVKLLRDDILESRQERVEKEYYLDKLNLTPRDPKQPPPKSPRKIQSNEIRQNLEPAIVVPFLKNNHHRLSRNIYVPKRRKYKTGRRSCRR